MGQTLALPLIQAFNGLIRHRPLHVHGNSAALESFAGSDHGEKYGVPGVLTRRRTPCAGLLPMSPPTKLNDGPRRAHFADSFYHTRHEARIAGRAVIARF